MSTAEPSTATDAPASRIAALDGVRGLAILLVLIHHFSRIPADHIGAPVDEGSRWLKFTGIGWIGVDLFFVLSGFLITSILVDSKGPALRFFKSFYARRVLRIFPVYYAMVAFLLLVLPWIVSGESDAVEKLRDNQLWLWFYMVNIELYVDFASLVGTSHLVGHLWSLAVEEHYYLIWPLFVYLLGRRQLIVVTGALAVVAAIVRVALLANGDAGVQVFGFTPARMDALAIGSGIALLVRSQAGRDILRAIVGPLAVASLAALVVLFIVRDGLPPFDDWIVAAGLSFVALLFGGVVASVVLAPPGSAASRLLSRRPLTFLGKYSYALYVIHFPVVELLSRHLGFGESIASSTGFELLGVLVVAGAASAITFPLALLSWRVVETPFLRLRAYFHQGPVKFDWGAKAH